MIVWATNEPASSQVEYGTTLPYSQTSALNSTLTSSHSVLLSALTPSTLYHYAVESKDAAGNLAVSADYTFTTTDVPAITLVNHSQSVSCGNATTCSVALEGPVSHGNFLVITAWAINPVHVLSISAGGTFVDGYVRNGTAATRGFLSGGYVSSTATTRGPIVVNFSGATGGAQVNIREYSVSSGTLVLDATGDILSKPTPNPIVAPTVTLTGTNDLIVSWAGASTNIASVASPYGDADIANDETGSGTADLLNTTTGTAPSWSAVNPATAAASASLAFGFQPHPCDNMALMDSRGGVAGNVMTPPGLNASTRGAGDTGNTRDNWSWNLVNTGSAFSWSTAAHRPLVNGLRFCSGGATYVDGSSLGVEYNTSNGSGQYAQMMFPGTWYETVPFVSNTASAGIWFYTSLPQTATVNADIFTIFGSSGGYINVILFGNGNNLVLKCEMSIEGCTTSLPVIQSNTWYWITLQYNNGGVHYGAVYNNSLKLLDSFSGADPANTPPGYVAFGHLNVFPLSPNAVMRFDKLKVCYIGNCYFPVMP